MNPKRICLCALALSLVIAATCNATKAQTEEVIDNLIPKHLPIKVELVFEKGSPKVLETVKFRVTNTGTRPIYFLGFFLEPAKDPELDKPYVVSWIRFGRTELLTFGKLANSEDLPLQPGENVVVEPKGVELFRAGINASLQTMPRKYELIFQQLNFGDGTGFWGSTGAPFPEK